MRNMQKQLATFITLLVVTCEGPSAEMASAADRICSSAKPSAVVAVISTVSGVPPPMKSLTSNVTS